MVDLGGGTCRGEEGFVDDDAIAKMVGTSRGPSEPPPGEWRCAGMGEPGDRFRDSPRC